MPKNFRVILMKMKTEPEEGGGEVNSSKEMESKTSLYFQKKKSIF